MLTLIGLPGCGKTTLGRRLDPGFTDLDAVIVREAGCSIAEIFERHGEQKFREIETETLMRHLNVSVLSVGGGAVLQNAEILRKCSTVVYLDRLIENILRDLDASARPLLVGNPRENLLELREKRHKIYENAAHLIFPLGADAFVIGDPIEHSLSPAMHAEIRPDKTYRTCHVRPEYLEIFCRIARVSGAAGFNVTIPHKKAIIPYLDELKTDSGAVNTVKIDNGKLIGCNTDIPGIELALNAVNADFSRAAILGDGGAATAIATLFDNPLIISRRNGLIKDGVVLADLSEKTLLINATSLGMAARFADFDFLKTLPPSAVVYDIVYSPLETELVKHAKALGFNAYNGLSMLCAQAMLASGIFYDKGENSL